MSLWQTLRAVVFFGATLLLSSAAPEPWADPILSVREGLAL